MRSWTALLDDVWMAGSGPSKGVEAPAARKSVEATAPGFARAQSARNERAAMAARRALRHLQRESCSESSAWKPLGECMAIVMHVG